MGTWVLRFQRRALVGNAAKNIVVQVLTQVGVPPGCLRRSGVSGLYRYAYVPLQPVLPNG